MTLHSKTWRFHCTSPLIAAAPQVLVVFFAGGQLGLVPQPRFARDNDRRGHFHRCRGSSDTKVSFADQFQTLCESAKAKRLILSNDVSVKITSYVSTLGAEAAAAVSPPPDICCCGAAEGS